MDNLFYSVIHNKYIFKKILNCLSHDTNSNNNSISVFKYSCKWLIENGYRITLKHKLINNHYLILDNNSLSKELEDEWSDGTEYYKYEEQEKEQEQEKCDDDDGEETEDEETEDEDENQDREIMKFQEIMAKYIYKKELYPMKCMDEFESLFKYFKNDSDQELYESIIKRYINYFQFDVGNTVIKSSINSNNQYSFETICKEFNYTPTKFDLFHSLYLQNLNISKSILSINTSLKQFTWKYLLSQGFIYSKPILNSRNLEDYFNFIKEIQKSNIKLPSDLKSFKKLISKYLFKCPIGMNCKLETLIKGCELINNFDCFELKCTNMLKSIKFTNKELKTELSMIPNTNKSVRELIEFYLKSTYDKDNYEKYEYEYEDEEEDYKSLMYHCKYGFQVNYINFKKKFTQMGGFIGINIIDTLKYANYEMLFECFSYLSTDYNEPTNPMIMIMEEIHFLKDPNDETQLAKERPIILFKYCNDIKKQKQFITKLVGTEMNPWVLFCLVVEYGNLELIKFTFDKLKLASNHCKQSKIKIKSQPVKKISKRRKLEKEDEEDDEEEEDEEEEHNEDDEDGYHERTESHFSYLIYKNIYNFVHSEEVLKFIVEKNFNKKGKIKEDHKLFIAYTDLMKSKIKNISTSIINCDQGNELKKLRNLIEFGYKFINLNDNQIKFRSSGREMTEIDMNNLNFIFNHLKSKSKSKFVFIPITQLDIDYSDNKKLSVFNNINLFKWVLDNNNFNHFIIEEEEQLKYMMYLTGNENEKLYNYSNNDLTLNLVFRYGNLEFIEKYCNANKKNSDDDQKVLFSKMVIETTRFGNLKVLKFIEENYPQFIQQEINWDFIHTCLKYNYLEIFEFIIEKNLISMKELKKITNNSTTPNSLFLYITNLIKTYK